MPAARVYIWSDNLGIGSMSIVDALEAPVAASTACEAPRPCQRLARTTSFIVRGQAPADERRSHSSSAMRPRRASPNGTSERSSTRAPKYRASGSRTTCRESLTAFR
jgi:hypothetical protein